MHIWPGNANERTKGMRDTGASNGSAVRLRRIAAVVPAFNEESAVGVVVRDTTPHVPVMVIDDGSSDLTAAQAVSAGAYVLRHPVNRGKGAALQTGFRWALARGYDGVITLDADGQHDPSEIPKFLTVHQRNPEALIVGNRSFAKMPLVRGVGNSLGRYMLRMTLGNDVQDSQCGYRLVPEWLLKQLLSSRRSGFDFELEMMLAYLAHGLAVEWVPVRTIYAGESSHVRLLCHVVEFLRLALHPCAAWSAVQPRSGGTLQLGEHET